MKSFIRSLLRIIKSYWITLLTLMFILFLTFFNFKNVQRTETVVLGDKIVHLVMYFTLCAVFWYESFKLNINVNTLRMLFPAIVVPAIFSGAMEYAQSVMTKYRTGDFDDFVFNVIGVLLAAVFSLLVTRPLMRRFINKR